MKPHSLARRVVFAVVLVELLCAGCFAGFALWHEWRTRVFAIDALLQGRSDSLLGAVQDAEDAADSVIIDSSELKLPKSDFYSVYNAAGELLGGSERNAFPLTAKTRDGLRSMRFNGQSYRVLERRALRIIDRAETGGVGIRRPVTLVYAIPVSTAHLWHEILEAAGFYILSSLLFTAITALILLTLMRQLLQPVQELAAAAAGVSPASLSFQPPVSAVHVKELVPLVGALSSTINGLKDALERQHRFVGDAAHELKTAIAVLRSTIQVLSLKSRSVEEYKVGLQAALEDNERVEQLVGRMLLLAHVEERTQPLRNSSTLAQNVDQAIRDLSSYAEARHVLLQPTLEEDIFVPLSAEDLRTLATNLIVNAVQHSEGGSSISVRAFRRTGSYDVAVFEVEDAGAGIASEDLPFVFDRFYRADSSRSRETGGVGLGLAICKNLVEAAGGVIDLHSATGRGTIATVTLPLAAQGRTS